MSLSTQALSLAGVDLRESQGERVQREQANASLVRGLVDRGTTPPSAVTDPNNTSFNVPQCGVMVRPYMRHGGTANSMSSKLSVIR